MDGQQAQRAEAYDSLDGCGISGIGWVGDLDDDQIKIQQPLKLKANGNSL